MSTTTPTHVDQVGGEAASAQQAAVEKRRGGRQRTGGSSGGSSTAREPKVTAVARDTQSIAMTFDELLSISTTLVAASTDDITPVIETVRIRQSDDRVDAMATDRYRVAAVDFPRREQSKGVVEVKVTRDLLTKAISVGKIGGDHKEMRDLATVILTVEKIGDLQHTTLESVRGWRFAETEPAGVFPPIDRLWPEEGSLEPLTLGIRVDMKKVADAAKVRVPGQVNPAQTDTVWSISGTKSDSPNKPGPLLFTQTSETGRARYLLQPQMVQR